MTAAAQQLQFPLNTEICVIAFSSGTQVVPHATFSDLVGKLDRIVCGGTTCMSGVMNPLFQQLSTPGPSSFAIVVVSDGIVDHNDRQPTVAAAQSVAARLKACGSGVNQVPITAVLLRTLTSASADPDTRALASIGSLCTEKVSIVDVKCYGDSEEIGLFNLTQAMVEGLRGCTSSFHATLETEQAILRRLPTDAPCSSMRVACGRATYLLLDTPLETLRINGKIVRVIDDTPTGDRLTEESFRPFVEFVIQQIQMWTIVGSRDADIARIRAWFQELQAYLSSIESNAAEDADLSVLARSRSVMRAVKKRQGSIIDQLLQLENKQAVAALNSQQQANWLNSVKDDRGGRALAKRAQRAQGGEIDYSEQAQTAVTKIAASRLVDEDAPNDIVSFYSQSDSRESTVLAARELLPACEELSATDVLSCIGLNGVPFQANAGNYVDPFSLRIRPENLFVGQILGEPDIWVRRIQGGNTTNFACPGRPETNITGVIALCNIDREAYQLMTSPGIRPYYEMQCAAQIRGALAVVPHDAIALSGAGAWCLLETFGKKASLTSLERETLAALVENLHHLIGKAYAEDNFKEIHNVLCTQADVRPWLSGDRNISNSLQVVVTLLRYSSPPPNLQAVLRALYHLDCYQSVKRQFKDAEGNRTEALKTLLEIDLNANGTPTAPLFAPELADIRHFDRINVGAMALPRWIPPTRGYVALWAHLTGKEKIDPEDDLLAFGMHPHSLRSVRCPFNLCFAPTNLLALTPQQEQVCCPIPQTMGKQPFTLKVWCAITMLKITIAS